MITTIQVDSKVKEKLDKLKIHHRESYNELILRLIDSCKGQKISKQSLVETIEVLSDPETMRELAEALEDYRKGGGKTLEEVEKELNL